GPRDVALRHRHALLIRRRRPRGRRTRAGRSRRELRPVHERHRAALCRRRAPGDGVARGARLQVDEHAPLPDAQGPRAAGRDAPPVDVWPPPAPYPLAFRQGRTLPQFHGFYDHGRALPTLANADPEPYLWIAPADAAARAIADGAAIKIHNERGEFHARARVTEKIPAGAVWMRDGWEGLNRLTSGAAA